MAKPYVHERQSEYWTSRQIEDFFENYGNDVHTIPVPTKLEKKLPADFIFIPSQKIKLFGLQYKALYQDSSGDYWKLDTHQHAQLAKFSWIYYAFSELKVRSHKRNSLHLLKIFTPTSITFPPGGKFLESSSSINGYYRWGGFYKRLEDCKSGLRIHSEDELRAALAHGYYDIAADLHLFLHNFSTGVTVSVNRLLGSRNEDGDLENGN